MANKTFDLWEYDKKRGSGGTSSDASSEGTSSGSSAKFDLRAYDTYRNASSANERYNTFIKKYLDFIEKNKNRYSSNQTTYQGDYKDWEEYVSGTASELEAEASELKSQFLQYQGGFDRKTIREIMSSLSEITKDSSSVRTQAKQYSDFWSQWSGEEEYNKWYDNTTYGKKYEGMTYADIQKALASTEGRENEWLASNADYFMGSTDAQAEIDKLTQYKTDKQAIATELNNLRSQLTNAYARAGYGSKVKEMVDSDSRVIKLTEKLGDYDKTATADRIAVLEGIRDTAKRTERVAEFDQYTEKAKEFGNFVNSVADFALNNSYVPSLPVGNETVMESQRRFEHDREARDMQTAAARIESTITNSKLHAYLNERDNLNSLGQNSVLLFEGDQKNWKHLKEEEIQMYDYLSYTFGEERANEYLDVLQDTLNQREGLAIATDIESQSAFMEALYKGTWSITSGVDSFFGNMAQAFSDDLNPISDTQYANAEILKNTTGIGKYLYQAGFTVGNMLPSILLSAGLGVAGASATVASAAGSGAMALSASGGAYRQALQDGYGESDARTYGLLVGASEGALQYLLGGISSLGGVTDDLLLAKVATIDNALARIALTGGIKIGSEITEEELQNFLEPAFRTIIFGEEYDAPTIEELVETAIVTALSTGVLEGGGTISTEVARDKAKVERGESIIKSNGYDALKTLGNEVSTEGLVKGEATIGKLIEKTQSGVDAIKEGNATGRQKAKTAKQVAKLSQTIDSVRNEQNLAEIRSSLESKGLSKSRAQRAAKLLNEALYTDGAYSEELYHSVMNDDWVMETLRELVSSPDSTLKSRNTKHSLGRMGLKVGKDGKYTSSANTEEAEAGYVDESLSLVKDASKRTYEASAEGKTIVNTTGDAVDIVEVASFENGQMMLKVKSADGSVSTVNARDVSFANESEALVYEAVANMGIDAVSANSIVKSYNPGQNAEVFALGMQEAYRYGRYNYSENEMYQEGNFLLDLTDAQIKRAYKLGQIRSGSDTAVAVAKLKEAIANSKGKKGEGKVHFEGDAVGIDVDGLKDQQKVSLKTMEMLSKATGIEFYVYASYKNAKGERVYKDASGKVKRAPNGIYDKKTGAIHIDLNAGQSGEGTMLYTIAHELTHFIKAWSPAKFKVLANFLVEQYGKKGVSVEALVRNQMANMQKAGRKNVTYDIAFEEFVADSMETMLTSGNVVRDLAEIKRRDEGLWNKIKEFFSDLVEHLKKAVSTYSEFAPDTVEGQMVAEMTDAIEQLEKLFTEGLVDASENFRAISYTEQETLAEAGIGFDEDTRSVYSLRYSTGRKDALGNVIDLVKVGKKEFNTEAIAQLVAKGTGRSIEDARKWVNSEIAIANIVMNHPEFLDFQADERYESIKKNSDYPQGTVDLSNLCPKRTEFTAMFDMLQKKYPNKLFTANDVAAMRGILKKRGITVACGACFVEDRRQLLGEIADTYIGMWREAVETGKPLQKTNASGNKVTLTVTAALAKQYGLTKGSEILATDKYIPTQYDLTTYEGFKLLEKNHPTIAMGFNRYNNSRGQQAGRLIEGRAEYNRQILGWSPTKIKSVNNNGGLRIFSFSDFEVVHLLDLVQVIIDCSAMGVKIQGYTKIPSFARLIRDTGIKINRSLIPKGQTGMKKVDGKWVLDYDTTEGIDINDENFIDERDNPNVGNILIGINPTQIGLAMLDDFVDYIIPFHTNKSKDICKALGLAEWVNYKESQHEKDVDTGKASKHNVNIYTEVINKYHPTNKVEFVEAFLKVCKAQKKIPRYSEFLNKEYKADGAYTDEYGSYDFTYREGYHKLLVDFKMFDSNGNILPQGEITPNLDEAFMAELLQAEVDKKKTYQFPEEVYEQLDREFGGEDVLYSERKKKVDEAVDKAIKNKGDLGVKYNQERISEFPADITAVVSAASEGRINLAGKYIAISGDDIWHEYTRHNDGEIETGRKQLPLTNETIKEAVMAIYSPDVVESLFSTNQNPTQRQSFAYAKKSPNGYYIVVEAVGGRRNPNVVPVMLVQFSEEKWNEMIASGKTLGELIHENDARLRDSLDVEFNKKNRVTVAQFASQEAIANTPRSPQFDDIIPQSSGSVNTSDENPHSDRNKNSVSSRALLANALDGTVQTEFEKKTLADYKQELARADALEKELAEIRSKLKELYFAKGFKDAEAIKKLRDQETKAVNRIDVIDKKLLRLEATKPLKDIIHRERQKAYKKAEAEGKEALARYRAKSAETQRELLNRWKESRHKAVENRHKSEILTKIKNFKKKLEGMLQHPTDRQYVPHGLASAMIEVCELINTDTPLYKKDGSINKAQERRNLTKERLRDLKDEYEKLKKHPDPMYSGEFDETVYAYLTDLQENFGGKNLADMTIDELRVMYETLRAIEETLQDARKLIGHGDAYDVYEAGDAIASEQAEIAKKRKNGHRSSAQKTRDKTLNYTLSPVRNVERMSGYREDSFLLKLFKKFEHGIRKKNKFVMESYKLFEALTTGANAKTYEDAIYKEYGGKKFTDINGRTFGISKMQMMQTILSFEREVANGMHHIEGSGFSFADLDMLRKGKLKDAVSEEYSHRVPSAVAMVQSFQNALQGDKWAQDYMAMARKFFNEKAKDAINETMLATKHRIIARDKNYIPFEVDKNFVVREISAQNNIQQTINSYGMLKETKTGASQPLIITGLNNILDRHIDQVGNVYGLAIEVRNFNKVWNVRTMDSAGSDPTVKAAVQKNWGVEGVAHIEQAVQDIQGSRPNEQSALYRKIKSNYIGATFLLNLSVVTKQIGSLFASTSMLRYRSPIRMMGNLIHTMVNYKKIAAEVDKYTATAWVRRQGLSDAELQTLLTEGKKSLLGKLVNKLPTAINPAKWIQGMDSAVALSLWKYAKQDVAKKNPDLKGEELLKATAEFYDDVIENTQSMTDVLHRPEVQKKGDLLSETLGMFKTDLYQMAGQLQVTAGRYSANKSKENASALVRTASAVVASAVWAQLMTTLFALLRYKVDRYRDDDDEELTEESWLKRQSFSLVSDLVGYLFPLAGSEIVGFLEMVAYGEPSEIVDNIVLTAINDVSDLAVTIASSVKDGEMPSVSDTQRLLTKALQLFGVPANNIARFVNAIALHTKDIINGEFLSFEAGVERNSKHHVNRIVEAMASGDTDVAMGLFEEAVDELALRKAKDGEVTEDDIKEAKSDLKTALGNKYKEGEVDLETATEILYTFFEMGEEDIYWTFDKWDYAIENGTTDEYDKYDDLIKAVETGDPTAVINDLIEMKTTTYYDKAKAEAEKNGEKFNEKKAMQEAEKEAKSTIKSAITKHFKPLYKEAYKNKNEEEMKRIRYMLRDTKLYGSTSDLLNTVKGWLKD